MSDRGWKPGDPHAICDVCGFQFRRSQMRMRWDNLFVCRADWEPRHPQEYVKGKRDRIAVPNARPEPEPRFLAPGDVKPEDL